MTLNQLIQCANQGDAKAQCRLGWLYYKGGGGVPQDYKKAIEWYSKAARQGDPEAWAKIGWMYYKGKGVPQNYGKAFEWYSKAAKHSHASAQGMLGAMYYEGQGVPQNYALSYLWFNLSVSQGDARAIKVRDFIKQKLTPAQIAKAQQISTQWLAKHPQKRH